MHLELRLSSWKKDISLVEKLMCYHQLAMVVNVSCHDYCACEILVMSDVIIGGKYCILYIEKFECV